MRGTRYVGTAFVVVAMVLGSTSADASAHTFKASQKGELKVKQMQEQLFTTAAGTIECEELTGKGTVNVLETEVQTATIEYKECYAFGIEAIVSPVEYEFNANGTVSILKAVTIKASAFCTIKIPAQSKLSSVRYINLTGGKLELEPDVLGITSTGSGSGCGYGTESDGSYAGRSEVELVGGTLEWL